MYPSLNPSRRLLDQAARLEAETAKANAPLTAAETRNLGIANVWIMDTECDGGTVPPRIAQLNAKRDQTPSEKREIIAWAVTTAPGWYDLTVES